MQLAWLGALALAMIVAIFAVQNTAPVTVSFLVWNVSQAALALVIVVSVALGALFTVLLGLPRTVRMQWRARRLRNHLAAQDRRIVELEAELERLRNRPAVR